MKRQYRMDYFISFAEGPGSFRNERGDLFRDFEQDRQSHGALTRHFARRDERACFDFMCWFDDMDRIRGRIASFINCTAMRLWWHLSSSMLIARLTHSRE